MTAPIADQVKGQAAGAELPDFSQLVTLLYGSRYELLSLIGVGGGGSVYRARDIELDELVALKVLRKELLRDRETVERFRNEVRLARRVTHRNVARMFDIGEHEGEKFLTMELIHGEPLTRRIGAGERSAGRPLPLLEVTDIIEQVCAGLSAAHQSGVVHCDLKPDNLLLAKEDGATRVVITDFGIARGLLHTPSPTTKGRFDGTPLYVSPEQVEGSRLDARTDIFSLGVVLYEMLTGTPPFTGNSTVAVVAARVLRPPPDLSKVRPDLPAAVAQVVLRCLARDPADRFQQAVDIAAALRRVTSEMAQEETRILSARAISLPAAAPSPAAPPVEDASMSGQTVVPLTPAKTGRTIAVLPLRNHGAQTDEYLAEGLSQDLIDSLAALKGVRVYSRGAVAPWMARESDALAIGRGLGVELVMEGTLRRAGDRLRIAVRLISVADGFQIFTERYDCQPGEILGISDSLCAAVASALALEHAHARRAVPARPDAVERYLRARYLYGLSDRASIEESVRLLEEVESEIPNEPTLLMSYALSRARLWFFGDHASADKARAAAERVVAVVPQRGEAHLALGVVRFQGGDLPAAVRAARRALALSPELADAHELLGRILVETGPIKEGLAHIVHARALDPGLTRTLVDQARTYALVGQYDQAHALLADPQIDGKFLVPWITRGRLCLWARDERRAQKYLSTLEKDRATYPRAWLLMRVAAGHSGQVQPREVLVEGLGSDSASPRSRAFFYQMHAELFSFWQQHELAVRSIARAVDAGLTDLTWIERCPPIVALSADPRVVALRRVVYERALLVREAAAATAAPPPA